MTKAISRVVTVLLAAVCAGSASGVWAVGPAPKAVAERQKGAYPQMGLPSAYLTGQPAIAALGDRLAHVAAWYGQTPARFKANLLRDSRMHVDRRGRVLFVEPAHKVQQDKASALPRAMPAAGAGVNTGLLDGTLAPLEQTFLLHSKPGAKRTIYLNFRGATVSGTEWNQAGPSTIVAPPYDIDGVPSTAFSAAELQRIQYIWQRVAEDFAPFDVNVTTEALPRDRISRSSFSDDVFGTEVLITTQAAMVSSPIVASQCSTYGCGGIAYMGVFNEPSDAHRLALVFYDMLGNGSEKSVAEAISHEVGHNVGLGHDGTSINGYYAGHGTGSTAWAPIMGVGYDRPLVQWSKGEYSDANNTEDDFMVMQATGLPLRLDDHGNSANAATTLSGTVNTNGVVQANAQGVIETPSDMDVFFFSAGAGSTSISLKPAARSPNLDAVLSLRRNRDGALLASSNPVDAFNASISTVLAEAGGYTLWVQGTGKGDPKTNGYSNYGSLGQYALTVSYPAPTGRPPLSPATLNAIQVVITNLLLD